MTHPKLSEKALAVCVEMLARPHPTGEYRYVAAADLAVRLDMSKGTVGQILRRLDGYGWLEGFQEQGGGDRMYRFSHGGALEFEAARGDTPLPAPAVVRSPAEVGTDARPASMAELEATESPAVVAAVRRALGWNSKNRPIRAS